MACRIVYPYKDELHTLTFATRALAEAYARTVKAGVKIVLEDIEEEIKTRITKLGSAKEEESKRYIARHGITYAATETQEEYVRLPIGSTLQEDDEVQEANLCIFCKRRCGQAVACYNCRRYNANAT